jgi:hypothetical protein
MTQRSNEEVTIHKTELAAKLAHMYVVDELKYSYAIYEDESAGIFTYKENAQMIFDIAFDMYISVIEEIEI